MEKGRKLILGFAAVAAISILGVDSAWSAASGAGQVVTVDQVKGALGKNIKVFLLWTEREQLCSRDTAKVAAEFFGMDPNLIVAGFKMCPIIATTPEECRRVFAGAIAGSQKFDEIVIDTAENSSRTLVARAIKSKNFLDIAIVVSLGEVDLNATNIDKSGVMTIHDVPKGVISDGISLFDSAVILHPFDEDMRKFLIGLGAKEEELNLGFFGS
jgi:hypothetical protein